MVGIVVRSVNNIAVPESNDDLICECHCWLAQQCDRIQKELLTMTMVANDNFPVIILACLQRYEALLYWFGLHKLLATELTCLNLKRNLPKGCCIYI